MGVFGIIGGAAGAYFGGPAGAAAGYMIGSGLDADQGEDKANQLNRALYEDNRDWQERMSNTAVRRSADDFEKAGLNRLLATGAQASTPQMQTPVMQNTAKHSANAASGVLGAVQASQTAAKNKAQIAKTEAETGNVANEKDLLIAQATKARAEAHKAAVDTAVAKKGLPGAEMKNSVYDWFKTKAKDFMNYQDYKQDQQKMRQHIEWRKK